MQAAALQALIFDIAKEPEDIAHQIAYLLGPRAQFVTNTIFEVE